jgi:hypothetical protein
MPDSNPIPTNTAPAPPLSSTDELPPLSTAPPPGPAPKRDSSHRVAKSLLAPYRIVWLSVCVAILVPLLCLYLTYLALDAAKAPFRVIVIDAADNYIVGPLTDADQSPVFERTARLVVSASLSRNPNGFDNPEMVKGLFLEKSAGSGRPPSLNRMNEDLSRQIPNLRAQGLHQKVEISRMETVIVDAMVRKVLVYGQLIRSGKAVGRDVVQSEGFRFLMILAPNPKLGERGQFPYVVTDYTLRVGKDIVPPNAKTMGK